eukprot:TRINITY_DN4526_c0_g1_i3.p1 TRINITY_DN4526_c0_g1~~TRINITY_DN4526_c0_g1_i3.p1  ORF type:complete len:1077 (-),score=143.07 TRINITY_DN4526_c0_g1_i3:564-3794(-)
MSSALSLFRYTLRPAASFRHVFEAQLDYWGKETPMDTNYASQQHDLTDSPQCVLIHEFGVSLVHVLDLCYLDWIDDWKTTSRIIDAVVVNISSFNKDFPGRDALILLMDDGNLIALCFDKHQRKLTVIDRFRYQTTGVGHLSPSRIASHQEIGGVVLYSLIPTLNYVPFNKDGKLIFTGQDGYFVETKCETIIQADLMRAPFSSECIQTVVLSCSATGPPIFSIMRWNLSTGLVQRVTEIQIVVQQDPSSFMISKSGAKAYIICGSSIVKIDLSSFLIDDVIHHRIGGAAPRIGALYNQPHERRSEEFYFADEHGHIAKVTPGLKVKIEVMGKLWPCRAFVHVGNSTFLALGDLCHGGLVRIVDGPDFEVLSPIHVMAPVFDFVAVDGRKQLKPQIYGISGLSTNGGLSVLQSGYGFQKLFTTEDEYIGVTGLWSVYNHDESIHDTVLISSMESTRLLTIRGQLMQDDTENSEILHSQPTLYCGQVSKSAFVQVTANSIVVLKRSAQGFAAVLTWSPNETISVVSSEDNLVVVGLSASKAIVGLLVVEDESTQGMTLRQMFKKSIDCEPSCISLLRRQNGESSLGYYVFVGLYSPEVQMYDVPIDFSDVKHVSVALEPDTPQTSVMAHSLVAVYHNQEIRLCAGLRNGQLLEINLGDDPLTSTPKRLQKWGIGSHSLRLQKTVWRNRQAVIMLSDRCGMGVWMNGIIQPMTFCLAGTTHITSLSSAQIPDGMFAAAGNHLHFGYPDTQQGIHFEEAKIGKFVKRISFSDKLQVLFILYAPDLASRTLGGLLIVNPRTLAIVSDFTFESHEIPHCLCEWQPNPETLVLVVGMGHKSPTTPGDQHSSGGSITILRIQGDLQGPIDRHTTLNIQVVSKVKCRQGAITCLATMGSFLLMSSNDHIMIVSHTRDMPHVRMITKTLLRFPVNSIDVYESSVFVGCDVDGVVLFKWNEEDRILEYIGSESSSRIVSHVMALSKDTVMSFDGDCTLRRLTFDKPADQTGQFKTITEYQFNEPISRVCKVNSSSSDSSGQVRHHRNKAFPSIYTPMFNIIFHSLHESTNKRNDPTPATAIELYDD